MLVKLTKNILRGVNFTNLKTSCSYIAKSKPQGVCLQLSQTPGGDYAIWPYLNHGSSKRSKKIESDFFLEGKMRDLKFSIQVLQRDWWLRYYNRPCSLTLDWMLGGLFRKVIITPDASFLAFGPFRLLIMCVIFILLPTQLPSLAKHEYKSAVSPRPFAFYQVNH